MSPEDWTVQPSLSTSVAQGGVANLAGGMVYQPATEGEAGEIAFGGSTADFILYGVVDGAFSQEPPDPASNIEPINNPLQYWFGPVQVSGGAITCQWVEDSGSPSGHNLRFTVNPGAADDEAYVEQIVPVGGSRSATVGHFLRVSHAASAANSDEMEVVLALAYLDVAGNVIGTETTSVAALPGVPYRAALNAPQTIDTTDLGNAAFLRIRVSGKRGSIPIAETGVVDISDVRLDIGRPYMMLLDHEAAVTNQDPGYIIQTSGSMDFYPAGALALSLGPTFGRLLNVPLQLDEIAAPATPASGYLAIYADTSGVLRPLNDAGTSLIGVEGVAFPATQVASADANTLDDYETRSTFTPAPSYTTPGTSSWSTSAAVGRYQKVGNRVHYSIILTTVPTNGTASGSFIVSGMPFTSVSLATPIRDTGEVSMGGWTKANYTQISCNIANNGSFLSFRATGSGQTPLDLQVADIPSAGTVSIRASGSYEAAA